MTDPTSQHEPTEDDTDNNTDSNHTETSETDTAPTDTPDKNDPSPPDTNAEQPVSAPNDSDEATDSTRESEQSVEETAEDESIIPELHDDVYKRPFKGVDTTDPVQIADAVHEISPKAAITIEQLLNRIEDLEQENGELQQRLQKKQREFQNFKERKNSETEEIKDTATKDFIKDALPIRDNLVRALDQDTADIRSGVELIKEEFDELLQSEGLEIIDPSKGDEINPEIHEVMTRVESDAGPGTIVECYRPGYVMEDTVVRPARVTVSSE